jgi:hypothetical protein
MEADVQLIGRPAAAAAAADGAGGWDVLIPHRNTMINLNFCVGVWSGWGGRLT